MVRRVASTSSASCCPASARAAGRSGSSGARGLPRSTSSRRRARNSIWSASRANRASSDVPCSNSCTSCNLLPAVRRRPSRRAGAPHPRAHTCDGRSSVARARLGQVVKEAEAQQARFIHRFLAATGENRRCMPRGASAPPPTAGRCPGRKVHCAEYGPASPTPAPDRHTRSREILRSHRPSRRIPPPRGRCQPRRRRACRGVWV